MKGLSLFSGIGGLDLAATAAGIEVAGMCEIAEYPQEVLKRRFPNARIVSDIHDVHGEDWRDSDIVFGGFPCQDLSFAGRRAGLSGMRSGLWAEMLRVVSEIRPYWVMVENVRGAVSLALDSVRTGLEDEGYVVWPFVLPASAFGAPHLRERMFVVGARQDVADAMPRGLPAKRAGEPAKGDCGCREPTTSGTRSSDVEVRGLREQPEGPLSPEWVEILMGFPVGWTDLEAEVVVGHTGWPMPQGNLQYVWEPPRTVRYGVPHRTDRIMALGNAVVPQQALPLMEAIVAIDGIIANNKEEKK